MHHDVLMIKMIKLQLLENIFHINTLSYKQNIIFDEFRQAFA